MIPGGPKRGEVFFPRLHDFPSRQSLRFELNTVGFLPQFAEALEWAKNVTSIDVEIERPCWSSRYFQRRFTLRPVDYIQRLSHDGTGCGRHVAFFPSVPSIHRL